MWRHCNAIKYARCDLSFMVIPVKQPVPSLPHHTTTTHKPCAYFESIWQLPVQTVTTISSIYRQHFRLILYFVRLFISTGAEALCLGEVFPRTSEELPREGTGHHQVCQLHQRLRLYVLAHFTISREFMKRVFIMTSSYGYASPTTGPCWGEFIGHRWIPPTKGQ